MPHSGIAKIFFQPDVVGHDLAADLVLARQPGDQRLDLLPQLAFAHGSDTATPSSKCRRKIETFSSAVNVLLCFATVKTSFAMIC